MSVHLIDLLWGIPSESRVFKQAFVTSLRSDHRVGWVYRITKCIALLSSFSSIDYMSEISSTDD